MACVLHKGPFETIHFAYKFMLAWVEQNQYQPAGPDRVLYLNIMEEPPPDEMLQQMQLPIARL